MKKNCDESQTHPNEVSGKKYGLAEMDGQPVSFWVIGNRNKSICAEQQT
jgi:hypothetical protein